MAVRDLDAEEQDKRRQHLALTEKLKELDLVRDQLAKRESTIERRMIHEKQQLELREKELSNHDTSCLRRKPAAGVSPAHPRYAQNARVFERSNSFK